MKRPQNKLTASAIQFNSLVNRDRGMRLSEECFNLGFFAVYGCSRCEIKIIHKSFAPIFINTAKNSTQNNEAVYESSERILDDVFNELLIVFNSKGFHHKLQLENVFLYTFHQVHEMISFSLLCNLHIASSRRVEQATET